MKSIYRNCILRGHICIKIEENGCIIRVFARKKTNLKQTSEFRWIKSGSMLTGSGFEPGVKPGASFNPL